MNELDFNWAMGLSDEQIRVNLKRHFGMPKALGERFFSTGLGHQVSWTEIPVFPPQYRPLA